jgi:hypothetical protein
VNVKSAGRSGDAMGDLNQMSFIKANRARFRGPYLEIGTKVGQTQKIRELFHNSEYVGLDMEDGPGVDVVADLTDDFMSISKILARKKFNTVFCLSVLEHCTNPFVMCENITRLLNQEGVVYVSVPFSWKFHKYPSDYWRFTPDGIRLLFPKLEFDEESSRMSTSEIGDIRRIDTNLCRIHFSVSECLDRKEYGMATKVAIVKLIRRCGIASWILRYRYLFPPVMINMIGVKKQEPSP